MRPLIMDDLLPLDEYARRHREFFDSHRRYVDRYRRVRVGPRVTLHFENRQTLWFHVQELIRVARLIEPNLIQQELQVYNRLLPGKDCLQAALLLDPTDASAASSASNQWEALDGDLVKLCVGDRRVSSTLITCRPEDRCNGTAHWLQFSVNSEMRRLLGDFRRPAFLDVSTLDYHHVSLALTEDLRQSLLDDLDLSDRD
jgi:hypothetical protein